MKIILPFYTGDAALCIKNLEWCLELDGGPVPYEAFLAADITTNIAPVEAVARKYFSHVGTIRYPPCPIKRWPWCQNHCFAFVCRAMPAHDDCWLWLETDSVAIKRGWLTILDQAYQEGGKPFMGRCVHNFNGVAVYPANVVKECPQMVQASMLGPDKAGNQPPWDAYATKHVLPKLNNRVDLFQHRWTGENGLPWTFPDQATVDRLVSPTTVLFHRCKDGTLIDRLRERKNAPPPVAPVPIPPPPLVPEPPVPVAPEPAPVAPVPQDPPEPELIPVPEPEPVPVAKAPEMALPKPFTQDDVADGWTFQPIEQPKPKRDPRAVLTTAIKKGRVKK